MFSVVGPGFIPPNSMLRNLQPKAKTKFSEIEVLTTCGMLHRFACSLSFCVFGFVDCSKFCFFLKYR
ncbi:hypothetical protein Fmac_010696 [Flemingia macrophylla]|uniref:Uncharacterized protein n=1 Tax=Flemingia macrophylla TaxID=520843 RepID=A0ABD1MKC0_9FABA